MNESPRKVCCGKCGFIAQVKLVSGGSTEDVEIPLGERESGSNLYNSGSPHCILGQKYFLAKNQPDYESLKVSLNLMHECPEFFGHVPGQSPKDHVMLAYQKSLRDEAAKREREMRDWQTAREEADRIERSKEGARNRAVEDKRYKFDKLWAVVTVLIGGGIATLSSCLTRPEVRAPVINIVAPASSAQR